MASIKELLLSTLNSIRNDLFLSIFLPRFPVFAHKSISDTLSINYDFSCPNRGKVHNLLIGNKINLEEGRYLDGSPAGKVIAVKLYATNPFPNAI